MKSLKTFLPRLIPTSHFPFISHAWRNEIWTNRKPQLETAGEIDTYN